MIKEYPHIETTRIETLFNGKTHYDYKFKWVGSKYAVVEANDFLIKKEGLSIYPWPLKIVGELQDFGRTLPVVRKDVGGHAWWLLVSLWYKLFRSRGYRHFKWRVIMTFNLWGLGYQLEGVQLSWKNVWRKNGKA
jgi:hypothetical protein